LGRALPFSIVPDTSADQIMQRWQAAYSSAVMPRALPTTF
jgi:hypothetical protein